MTRVRFAPAPTGSLHIGGARTYVFNWLFARHNKGQVALRIDDTDVDRSSPESLPSILDGLKWLELPWDEQHHQSWRRDTHVQAAQGMLAKGLAYRDFTQERDQAEQKQTEGAGAQIEPKAETNLAKEGARELLHELAERLAATGDFGEQTAREELRKLASERDVKAGLIINAARAAPTGQSVGPSAFAIFSSLGRDRVLRRLQEA